MSGVLNFWLLVFLRSFNIR